MVSHDNTTNDHLEPVFEEKEEESMKATGVQLYRNPFWRSRLQQTKGSVSEGWDRAIAKYVFLQNLRNFV